MLMTETNTPQMERKVTAVVVRKLQLAQGHHHMSVDFEHGQWWASCLDCGAQWGVHDLNTDDFCFEQVTTGDESCR